MSRSLGDNCAKMCGVIAVPTVRIVKRNKEQDRAILVCSDGISDQCSPQEMEETVQHYYKSQDTENCCKQLVDSATEKWHTKHSMQDDITAIVIFLRWFIMISSFLITKLLWIKILLCSTFCLWWWIKDLVFWETDKKGTKKTQNCTSFTKRNLITSKSN